MLTLRLLIIATVAGTMVGQLAVADDRAAVPSQPDQEKVEALIKELFKGEYARNRPADRTALAAKLYKQGIETKDDPTAQYVLFRESRDLSARAADALGVIRAADALNARFALRSGEAVVPAVEGLVYAVNASNAATARTAVGILMTAADEARYAGEWDTALEILKRASGALQRAANPTLSSALRAKGRDLEVLKEEAEKVKGPLGTLKTNPDDPAACLAVGRFRTFFLQDWEAGLPLLAKGSDGTLRKAAAGDLKAVAGNDDDAVATGDAWYDLAESADAGVKPGMQVRAHHWYVKGFPSQTGLTKTRVEKRIAELQRVVNAKSDRTKMWGAIRRGVADPDGLTRERIVGGAFAQKTFEELPPAGGLLIGFNYTTINRGNFPGVIQPLYLTAHGEVVGGTYGVPGPGERKLSVKAKPGYAVGALYVRGGGGLDAVKPIFMRITDDGLDPKDSYEGPHIGGMGGNEGTLGGDGSFIVGLHGKVNDKGKMEAISPINLRPTGDSTPRRPGR